MIYHHYGHKRGLYLAVLEQAYHKERSAEQKLKLEALEPREAMQRLIEYTFDSFVKDRSFIKLLNDENLHKAVHLKQLQAHRRDAFAADRHHARHPGARRRRGRVPRATWTRCRRGSRSRP